jgi:hypothetical protein
MDFIKNDILRKLRMLQPPNGTAHARQLPQIQHVREIIDSANVETARRELRRDLDDDHATTMKIIAMSHPVPTELSAVYGDVIQFKFNASGFTADDVVSAKLGIYIRHTTTLTANQQQQHQLHRGGGRPSNMASTYIHVRSVRRKRPGEDGYQMIPHKKRIVVANGTVGQWMTFEVKGLVKHWLKQRNSQYRQSMDTTVDSAAAAGDDVDAADDAVQAMLGVEARNDRQDDLGVEVILNPQRPADQLFKPYIEIGVRESNRQTDVHRNRRSVHAELDCDDSSFETRCCRYPLTVDFTEFGWDWVLAPTRYEAYYCSGVCPFAYYQRHAGSHVIQQSAPSGMGASCCAASKFASLPLVYVDGSGGIVYGTLPGMIVERCGCA